MKVKTVNPKKCKWCGNPFIPFNTTDQVCSPDCAIAKAKKDGVKDRAKSIKKSGIERRKKNRLAKEALKTHSQWLQELQVIFNKFIRLRDAGKPCISCGTTKDITWSAGHFYPVGGYPNLRFNEDNAHNQCWFNCNKNKHGNLAEYAIRLPQRIGVDRFIELQSIRHKAVLKLSIVEIKELKTHYRKLIKQLES